MIGTNRIKRPQKRTNKMTLEVEVMFRGQMWPLSCVCFQVLAPPLFPMEGKISRKKEDSAARVSSETARYSNYFASAHRSYMKFMILLNDICEIRTPRLAWSYSR